MQVMKFGGSTLRNKEGFTKMVDILNRDNIEAKVIVVSAFSTATRTLKNAAVTAEQGDYLSAEKIIESLICEHYQYCEYLLKDKNNQNKLKELYDDGSQRLKKFLKGISITEDLTERTLDIVLSFGELFAMKTIHFYLSEQGFSIIDVDSTKLIVSDSHYGKAKPLIKKSGKLIDKNLLHFLSEKNIVLTQGFVAKSEAGEITTMGMESSNLTAVVIAAHLGCKHLTFWTNVEGVRSADPSIVENTKSIPGLNYNLAYIAAKNGLRLIYPSMIEIARAYGIELIFRSAFVPDGDNTVISDSKNELQENLTLVQDNMLVCNISVGNAEQEILAKNYFQKILSIDELDPFIVRTNDSIKFVFSRNNAKRIVFPNNMEYESYGNVAIITHYCRHIKTINSKIPVLTGKALNMIIEQSGELNILKILVDERNVRQVVNLLA